MSLTIFHIDLLKRFLSDVLCIYRLHWVFINLALVLDWGHQTSSINRRCLHFYKIFLKATITEVRSENCTDSSFILRQSWGTFVFVVTVQRQNNLVFPDLPFQPNVSRSLPLGIFFYSFLWVYALISLLWLPKPVNL